MFDIAYCQMLGARDNQQDYFAAYSLENGELCLLADGMGGVVGGEIASTTAVKEAYETLKVCEYDIEECFKKALFNANDQIKSLIESDSQLDGMGTTLIIAFITEDRITWLSVGDSPIYRIRDGKIKRLNENHSIGGELDRQAIEGQISYEEAKRNPKRHFLTSAVIGDDINEYEINSMEIDKSDIILIASDGVETLSEEEILKICSSDKAASSIIEDIESEIDNYNKPTQDNMTVIMVKGR
jgi:serine/threonine protein phosphatase PrpC